MVNWPVRSGEYPAPLVEKDNCSVLVCQLCNSTFQTVCGYCDHMRMHAGTFRYKCDICGQGFMKNTAYEGHMNRHQDLKPYCCKYCKKTFSIKYTARRHEVLCYKKQVKHGSTELHQSDTDRQGNWSNKESNHVPEMLKVQLMRQLNVSCLLLNMLNSTHGTCSTST